MLCYPYRNDLKRERELRKRSDYDMLEHGVPPGVPFRPLRWLAGWLEGIRVEDISFDRKTITFRPSSFRRLKTRSSHRVVPLWPQLEEILREHVFGRAEPLGELLFPSPRPNGREQMIRDLRRMLDAIGERAGCEEGRIRTKLFRHTYCAARLQTLDRGVPVALYTVSRELGHSSTRMVERVYSHLGQVRHRSEVVEYRVEEFEEELGGRLTALGPC